MYKHIFLTALSIIVLAFLFIPLILIVITAFNSAATISIPLSGFSLKWFASVFKSRSLTTSLISSLRLALIAAVLGIIIGLFAAVAIVKRSNKASSLLLSFFMSPSLIPGIVIGYVLFQTLVVKLAIPIKTALIIGHLLVVLPYSVRIITAGYKGSDISIEEAAMTLGCSKAKAFIKASLPQLKSSMLSAFMLSFINSFNNIPVSMYLRGPGMSTLPYSMMNYIEYNYDPTVSALSVMLMAFTLVAMLLMDKAAGKGAIKA